MTGLITKDFLIIKRRYNQLFALATIALLIGAFFIFPMESAIYVPVLLAPMTVGLMAELAISDEKSGWKNYLPCLPLTTREIVGTRYVFCAIITLGTTVLSFCYGALSVLMFGHLGMNTIFLASLGGLLFAILMTIVGVPCAFFYKGELATGSMIWVIMLVMVIRYSGLLPMLLAANLWIAIPFAIAVLSLLAYISFRISILIYMQKIRLKEKGVIR